MRYSGASSDVPRNPLMMVPTILGQNLIVCDKGAGNQISLTSVKINKKMYLNWESTWDRFGNNTSAEIFQVF